MASKKTSMNTKTELVKRYIQLWEEVNTKQKELKLLKEQLYKEIEPGEQIGRVKNLEQKNIIVTDKLIEEIKKAGLSEELIEEKVSISKLREALVFNPTLQKHVTVEKKNVLKVIQGIF